MSTQMELIEQMTGRVVQDVFRNMLSMEISPETPPVPNSESLQIIGSVGFVGNATGIICLYTGVNLATEITCRMLGIKPSEIDSNEMVNDAIGELSNMVVGNVKSQLCDAGLPCTLTIPSIVRGQQLSIEGSNQVTRRVLGFVNSHHHLTAEILLKDPQPQ